MVRIRNSASIEKNKAGKEPSKVFESNVILDKKDFSNETTDIGGFTLTFTDPDKVLQTLSFLVALTLLSQERKWHMTHRKRHIGMTQRYLFACTLFQGLFYWSDILEGRTGPNIAMTRLSLGLFSLLSGILIMYGIIIPRQTTVLIASIIYGFPSLFIYYRDRATSSHWDGLFLVYGLCFLMLPKISPLNFIWGFSGSAIFSTSFIIISMFRLKLQEWILSSIFLLVIVIMFMYISYSSEKSSRERWLLRDRLNREHINLQMVASSIQEDLKRAAQERQSFLLHDVFETTNSFIDYQSIKPPQLNFLLPNYPSLSHRSIYHEKGPNSGTAVHSTSTKVSHSDESDEVSKNAHNNLLHTTSDNSLYNTSATTTLHLQTTETIQNNQRRLLIFVKGLLAWAICMCTGYAFDLVSLPISARKSEVNSSAAFALLMHCTGFSIFLLYFTGQIRWLLINAIVGISLLWIFNQTGMETKWVVFSTHSVGYLVLFTVIIIMVLVFGGVVLVWTNLVDFLKDVLIRYPQVKDDLAQKKVLEQVILRCLSDLPKQQQLLNPNVADVESARMGSHSSYPRGLEDSSRGAEMSDVSSSYAGAIRTIRSSTSMASLNTPPTIALTNTRPESTTQQLGSVQIPCASIESDGKSSPVTASGSEGKSNTSKSTLSSVQSSVPLTKLLQAKRPGCCYFCLRESPIYLLPACEGWGPSPVGADGTPLQSGIPMCTPYTVLAKIRETLSAQLKAEVIRADTYRQQCELFDSKMKEMESRNLMLERKISEKQQELVKNTLHFQETLKKERQQREMDVQMIISQHNAQLTELKRLYKSISTKADSRNCTSVANRGKLASNKELQSTLGTTAAIEVAHRSPKSSDMGCLQQQQAHITTVPSSYSSKVPSSKPPTPSGSNKSSLHSPHSTHPARIQTRGDGVVDNISHCGEHSATVGITEPRKHELSQSKIADHHTTGLTSSAAVMAKDTGSDATGPLEWTMDSEVDFEFDRLWTQSLEEIEKLLHQHVVYDSHETSQILLGNIHSGEHHHIYNSEFLMTDDSMRMSSDEGKSITSRMKYALMISDDDKI